MSDTLADSLNELLIEQQRALIKALDNRNAELTAALEPFAAFGRYIEANPRKGLADELYAWDGGSSCGKPEASIRQADLKRAAFVVDKLKHL